MKCLQKQIYLYISINVFSNYLQIEHLKQGDVTLRSIYGSSFKCFHIGPYKEKQAFSQFSSSRSRSKQCSHTHRTSAGFPNLGSGVVRPYKGGRRGKCKNKNQFLFNTGRGNHHKIPLIISQISK
mgnify:CR=1 FL=1